MTCWWTPIRGDECRRVPERVNHERRRKAEETLAWHKTEIAQSWPIRRNWWSLQVAYQRKTLAKCQFKTDAKLGIAPSDSRWDRVPDGERSCSPIQRERKGSCFGVKGSAWSKEEEAARVGGSEGGFGASSSSASPASAPPPPAAGPDGGGERGAAPRPLRASRQAVGAARHKGPPGDRRQKDPRAQQPAAPGRLLPGKLAARAAAPLAFVPASPERELPKKHGLPPPALQPNSPLGNKEGRDPSPAAGGGERETAGGAGSLGRLGAAECKPSKAAGGGREGKEAFSGSSCKRGFVRRPPGAPKESRAGDAKKSQGWIWGKTACNRGEMALKAVWLGAPTRDAFSVKMSSMDPLPPATPPSQKPTRIIKPRPPTRPRPYLPPRPDSSKLLRGPTPPLPPEGSVANDGCRKVVEPPCSTERQLHILQNSGAVRKIVVRFDHVDPEKDEADKPTRPTLNGSQIPVPVAENGEREMGEEKEVQGQLDSSEDTPLSTSSTVEQNGIESRVSCPSACPCVCHQQRPGMVLTWVPAPSQRAEREDGEEGPASDLSSSADEGGTHFRHLLVLNPPPAKPPAKGGRALKSHRSPRSKKPPDPPPSANGHAEGSVVLTGYRSTAEPLPPRCPPLMPKPPRRSKGGSPAFFDSEPVPPAIPPKAPVKPPRSSLGPLSFPRRGSLQFPLESSHVPNDISPVSAGEGLLLSPPSQPPPPPPSSQTSPPVPLPHQQSSPLTSCQLPATLTPPPPAQPPPPLPQGLPPAPTQPPPPLENASVDEHQSQGSCETDCPASGESDAETPKDRPSSVLSPKGPDWGLCLQDEPLYQTYRQAVISKEIKRQTVPRNSSFSSSDYGAPSPGEGPAGPRGPVPHSTLWQELPAVRESGLLGNMNSEERKMQESLFEVVTSEASYLRSLTLLIEHFMESRELASTILLREHRILFSNIRKVKEVSERFLHDLEGRLAESLQISDVCDIVEEHAKQSFSVYIDYVRNQLYQEKTYSTLMEKNPQFAVVVTRLQELPECQRLPFMSFLLLPFQRITRIKMLIENILRRTEEGSLREQNAMKALASVSKIIEECNSEVGRMRHMEELIHIASRIEFDKLKAVPIISQSRQLLKQGELLEVVHRGTIFGNKPKLVPIYLFLFNDLLLITQRKSSERFVALDYAHRSLVQAQGCGDTPAGNSAENSFYLTLLENHQGRSIDRLCRAPAQSDMHRWMGAFPCHESQPNNKQETIYEDWDCPQVQCIEAYVAAQADELSLEPTDIVNVLRKTNEGWYEGLRLADGRKGWFPSRYVQEITNEHVRRRNLRERYRVLQAARQLQLTRSSHSKGKYSSA
ncbi:rho guanine nucleotide exchange factor 15 [Heteronotia binoei]|uniref:rho guanine nucleotide exchange factor 15 n=1 Tax=Heteronotia binoei TaxID=13085 RepID=UPI00292D2D12|nr:rho guanine nucleotide exchange factor 15 [Heteronotia binoei]